MSVNLSFIGGAGWQFFDDNGVILSGGKIYTYAAGTTTPLATYTSRTGLTANTNPIVLDAYGRTPEQVWSTEGLLYKYVVAKSDDVVLRTWDNIGGSVVASDLGASLAAPSGSSLVGFLQSGTGAVAKTVQTKLRESVSVLDFGTNAIPGTTNMTTAIQAAISSGAKCVYIPSGTYLITSAITISSDIQLIGYGMPIIKNSTAGSHVFSAASISTVHIEGIAFEGLASSNLPSTSVGGQASTSTGLVSCVNCTEVTILNCEFSKFYNGIMVIKATRAWIENCYVHNWFIYGILASESKQFQIDSNRVITSDAAGTNNAYGIMATGDDVAVSLVSESSISFNVIKDVKCWDGIMSHSAADLRIIGNVITDVRSGIDMSNTVGNAIGNVIVSNNYIKSTDVNTHGASAALHGGILINGLSAGNQIFGVVCSGNIIDNFFNIVGLVLAGNCSNISISNARSVAVSGNVIKNCGAQQTSSGVLVSGTSDDIAISGNSLQGNMSGGGIRFATVTSTAAAIIGNIVRQTNAANLGIYLSSCTIPRLALDSNATNSNAGSEFLFDGTVSLVGTFYSGSAVYDPASIAAGASLYTTITVTGARLGDFVSDVSFSDLTALNADKMIIGARVTGNNIVTVSFFNGFTSAIDLSSGIIRVKVTPKNSA